MSKINPPTARIPKRPRNRPPTYARFITDELRGEAGYVSADIWQDLFGFPKKVQIVERKIEDIDFNGTVHQAHPLNDPNSSQRNPKTNPSPQSSTSPFPHSRQLQASRNGRLYRSP